MLTFTLAPNKNFQPPAPMATPPFSLNPPPVKYRASAVAATSRRASAILAAILLANQTLAKPAVAFDFRMTVPDQTLEEAESGIKSHAQSLLEVKELLMAESWREAQRSLRKSSALLKQDIYTIIQAKPQEQRPHLRRLYSNLFNGVTRLDYAVRDMDRVTVFDGYHEIVSYLVDIMSKL